MNNNINEIVKLVMDKVAEIQNGTSTQMQGQGTLDIPIGISNRHVHLSQRDLEVLFGKDYRLTSMKDLKQPGQFACKETVTVCGPKGAIEKVRVLGPVRSQSQVEILLGDNFKLGLRATPEMSGNLKGTSGATVVGPKGSIQLGEGVIVAQRHIHMMPEDAVKFGVHDGQMVSILCNGSRSGILNDVVIRANKNSALECHLDTEEANALGLNENSYIQIR